MKNQIDLLVAHLLNGNIFLQEAIEILEKAMIAGALERKDGNQSVAAKQLGIHRNTLQRKMVDYGLAAGRARTRRKPVARAVGPRKKKSGAA
jgi:Fis family transcriptional regulator, factor for inversion stimulation protein